MCPAEVEDEGVPLTLENQPQIQTAATFQKRPDTPESYSGVQMRFSEGNNRRQHGGQNFRPASGRNAFEKAWRGQ